MGAARRGVSGEQAGGVWGGPKGEGRGRGLVFLLVKSGGVYLQRVIDAVVDGRIDKPTYDGQMAKVGTELNVAQSQLAETLISEEELESLFGFAAWLLERVAGIWNSASPENKRRIQKALFPEGLTITKDGFRTTLRHLFFKQFEPIPVEESRMASPGGFERTG